MSWFLLYIKRIFLNLKGLSDASIASLTRKEYGLAVNSLQILMKTLVLISDEWFRAISWSSLLFGIFAIKKWVILSLTSFGTLNYDCVIKVIEIYNFLPLITNSVTIKFNFFQLIISSIISSKTITSFIWILFINIFVNIVHIIWILDDSFRIVKMIYAYFFMYVS